MQSPDAETRASERYAAPRAVLTGAAGDRDGGRTIVRSVAVGMVLLSATVSAGLDWVHGTEHLPMQMFRLALTGGLAFGLWRGSRAARWLAVPFLGISGLIGIAAGIPAPAPYKWPLLAVGALDVAGVALLTVPASVRAFFSGRG